MRKALLLLFVFLPVVASARNISLPKESTAIPRSGVARTNIDLNGNDLENPDSVLFDAPSSDAATTDVTVTSQAPFEGVNAANTSGGNINWVPATGAINVTGILVRADTAGDTIRINGIKEDGSTFDVTLTEGLDYVCAAAASDAACVCNIKAAVDAHATLGPLTTTYRTDGTCSDERLAIFRAGSAMTVVLTPSDTTNTVRVAGASGIVGLPDGSAAYPSIGFISDNDGTGTGIARPGANMFAIYSNGNTNTVFATNYISMYYRLTNSSAVLNLGTSAATGHTLASGDVIVGGKLEVDGRLYVDNGVVLLDNLDLSFGNSEDVDVRYSLAQTPDTFLLGVGADSNGFIICEKADKTVDFGHAIQTNPTLFIQSADSGTIADWISLAHDQTNPVFGSGGGDFRFNDDGNKGVATYIRTNTSSVTFAADPGDASKTATNLIPDGAFVVGFSSRVTTAGTNCATVDIGISGGDTDLFANDTAVALAETTDNTDVTADLAAAGHPALAASSVIVTGNVNCFGLVVALTVHYLDVSAATAN
jgi:hypothetical protein